MGDSANKDLKEALEQFLSIFVLGLLCQDWYNWALVFVFVFYHRTQTNLLV